MNKDVNDWVKTCLQCQNIKVNRHTITIPHCFPESQKCSHVHIDVVGPLPPNQQGYQYCLTMIDRFTRWPEAIALSDITADTVAKNLYENWICRYGCPNNITRSYGTTI